jgi:polyhydroxyalkanoate synthase
MAQQGSDNKDAFMSSALQFMQAGQGMAEQFMGFIGKAGNPQAAIPLAADLQALTALQKQFMDQQMSLWQSVLASQQGKEKTFQVSRNPAIAVSRRPNGVRARSMTTCIRPTCSTPSM